MIPQKDIQEAVVKGLERATGRPVVKQNTAGPRPELPFLSFTVTSSALPGRGTWADHGGEYRREVRQVWSLTAHGTRDNEAVALALAAAEWLELGGRLELQDRGIVVRGVGGVSVRDTVLHAGYEYRQGFDVTFALMGRIRKSAGELAELIETAKVIETADSSAE